MHFDYKFHFVNSGKRLTCYHTSWLFCEKKSNAFAYNNAIIFFSLLLKYHFNYLLFFFHIMCCFSFLFFLLLYLNWKHLFFLHKTGGKIRNYIRLVSIFLCRLRNKLLLEKIKIENFHFELLSIVFIFSFRGSVSW